MAGSQGKVVARAREVESTETLRGWMEQAKATVVQQTLTQIAYVQQLLTLQLVESEVAADMLCSRHQQCGEDRGAAILMLQ